MIKNRFKKLSILALSTVCLLANGQTHAMNDDKGLGQSGFGSSFLQRSQINSSQANALVLHLSQVLNLTEEQKILLSKLSEQEPEEFSRSFCGNSGLSVSSMLPSNIIWSAETELEKIFISKKGKNHFPSVAPLEIFHLINHVLLPKYQGMCDSRFGTKTKIDLPEYEKTEVKKFLAIHGDNINLIGNPDLLLTFLMLLEPLPHFGGNNMMHQPGILSASQICPWSPNMHYQPYGYVPQPIDLFLQYCGGLLKGEVVTGFEKFYNHLSSLIDSNGMFYQPMPDQVENKKRVRQEIMEALNKILTVGGRQLFNIETDGKVLDFQIPEWFTILRQLAHFELREWKRKEPLMEQLVSHYNAAHAALEEKDGKFYSGLSIAPYTITLNRTVEKNAVDRDTLSQWLDEEYKANEAKIKTYEVTKPHLSTLEKAVEWLDDMFNLVSKQGRVT